ncbi:hypothetical protein JI739_15330 [Ramlibacter sp. AW1]|uniref:Uncharacterized protein n=1 Tax=Ramlibacter aurantiacus TaxID=2801330 RepID=A0A937D2L3_9BURK|nr:hypothetical protein [Ramlibacter aurantiacus]MBL0421729.1 hypothetical protein [Ramlibacter aurantiacus]
MDSPTYNEPPLVRVCLGHAGLVAILGMLLPGGESLGWLHAIVWPAAELIPNAVRMTALAPDPIFAQTLIGISLWIAIFILAFHVTVMRTWGYHTKAFRRQSYRLLAMGYVWSIAALFIAVFWWLPYLTSIGTGRTHFLVRLATSNSFGVATAMNQLLISMPLFCLLLVWFIHTCTTTHHTQHRSKRIE